MSNSKNIDVAKNVIDIESKAVAAIADKIGKSFEDAVIDSIDSLSNNLDKSFSLWSKIFKLLQLFMFTKGHRTRNSSKKAGISESSTGKFLTFV